MAQIVEDAGLLPPRAPLGIFSTRGLEAYPAAAEEIREWAEDRGVQLAWGGPDAGDAFWSGCPVVVVLGGDGTLLAASNRASQHGCAVLSLNQGRFGFLTDVTTTEVGSALTALRSGPCWVEERMMIEAEAPGDRPQVFRALNDIVIHRGGYPRVIDLDAWVGEEHIGRLTGDGLVVCSPTGSTGYSLSCGGPVINPTMEAILCTPISPHTLAIRPLVASPDERVTVRVVSETKGVTVLVDGVTRLELRRQEEVCVRRSTLKLRLIRTTRRSFYETLRTKLRWGAREECT